MDPTDQSAQYATDSAGKVVQIGLPSPNGDGTYAVNATLLTSTPSFSTPTVSFNKPFGTYTWNIANTGAKIADTCFQILKITDVSQDPVSGNYTQTWDWFDPGGPAPYEEDTVVLSGNDGSVTSFTMNFSAGA